MSLSHVPEESRDNRSSGVKSNCQLPDVGTGSFARAVNTFF